MLATLSRMASADYYLEQTMSMRHPTEYYVGGIEPDGVWFNLNNSLGIANGSTVLPEDFKSLFNGFSPDGDKLTQNSGMEKRASGLDMTFSADKSVSAYWAITGAEERKIIESSMQEAVAETLEYLSEKGSYCRRGLDGKILEKCDFMAATFLHSTSREMDPQLHIHTAIMNIAFRQDGTTGAIHQPSFYQIYKSLGAISSFKLSQKLNQKLGLNFESYGKDHELRRIKDFPQDLVDLWSKRRKAILERASELGPLVSNDSRAMATIAVSSRPDKAQDFTREQLLQRFEKEGMDLGYSRDNIAEFLSQQVEYSVEKIWENMQKIPSVLSQNDAFFTENKLIDKVYRNADILMSEDDVKSQIPLLLNANKLVRLGVNKTDQEIFTTPEMIFLEKDVSRLSYELIKNASHKVDEKGIKKVLNDLEIKGINLSSEQKLALSNSTLNSGSISIIEGAAGSGKSVVLSSISDVFREQGYKVIGASTTWRVASELGSDCEIENFAIDKLLINEAGENKALDQKTVLIVDEAGTLSTEKMRNILQNVQDAGAKVILVGDREQQQPIGAGSGLRLCEEVVGSSRIDQIRRQNVTLEDVLIYKDIVNIIDPEVAQLPISLMAKSDKEILAKAFNLKLNPNGELQQNIITPLSNGEDTYKVVENYADIRGTLTKQTARLQIAMMPEEEKQKLLDQYSNEVSKKGTVWQRSASNCFKNGEAYKGIEMYYDRGNVKFGKTYSSTIWKMCNEYVGWKAQNPDKTSIIQARTNVEAEDINSALRKIYRMSGVISGDDVEIQVAGKSKGTTDTLTLAKGDVFRFGHRNQSLNVVNGTVGRVDSINQTEKGTRIICDVDGRKIDFLVSEMENFNKEIGLKQGYVTTFYSGQGITVDTSFQLIDQSLLRENMYSAATRHKNAAHFYINRELALEFVIEKLTEEELQKPIPEKRILEILASKWSVSGQKELSHDYMSDEAKELYQEFYNQLSKGKSIDNLLHADISQREAIREQKISTQDYTGEDLVARKRVGEFGDLRKDAAEIGEKIRQEIGETGVFYDHKDYGRYLDLRAQADAIASEIYSDIEIHRGGLLNYPNVGDEQLSVAHSRHTARSLVRKWHTAFTENREATADKLASEIINLVKAEKENGQKPAVKYMAAAIRQSGISNAWDNLYRGHEDHRERHIRETLSGSECLDRDKVLDYRRSSINVGRIYGELREKAGADLKLTEVEGYSKMLSAMKERDRLAVVASDISVGVLNDFNVSPAKLTKQADVGGARNLINQYALKDDTRSIEQRDQLAWKIVERVKAEKANALEDSAFKKIMSKSVMEKGVEWKQLFDHANAGKERQYLETLTREEKSVHRDVLRYRELDRSVGQHYKEALKESREQSVSREDTSSWKEMLSVGGARDRVAHTLVKSEQDFGAALKHYRVDLGKFAARVDRLEMVSLVDRYEGFKQEGRLLNAGELAGDILARVSIEKLDQKPRVTAREIFARGMEINQLRKEREDFSVAEDQAIEVFAQTYPEMKNNLDHYKRESGKLFNVNKNIVKSAIKHERLAYENNAYPDWFKKRASIHSFGQKVVQMRSDMSGLIRYHYRDVFKKIDADINEFKNIERRHLEQSAYIQHKREERMERSIDRDQGASVDRDFKRGIGDDDGGYSW